MVVILSKTVLILIILSIQSRWCSTKESFIDTTLTKTYKNVQRTVNVIKKWEFETDDSLKYPKGDKHKLEQISALWQEHYACLSRVSGTVTESGNLPGVHVTAFVRAVARLPCGLCVAPNEQGAVKWLYSLSPDSKFEPFHPKQHITTESNGNLTIYNVREDDTGIYMCKVGNSVGGAVFFDIVNTTDGYNVVKTASTNGPYAAAQISLIIGNATLKVFTSWNPWSRCSACGQVGRRLRHGMCYVKLIKNKKMKESDDEVVHEVSDPLDQKMKLTLNCHTLKLFEAFPGGIPCKSRYLPPQFREMPTIGQRRNEIMIGLCKVKCDNPSVFEVRSVHGTVLERANNSAGIYSLWQKQPPPASHPLTRTLFVTRANKINITCPGISFRDIPLTWRVGVKIINPRTLDRESAGRVHLNARDELAFNDVKYSDANLYSCWQRDVLVGTVKLVVWEGPQPRWNHHILLITVLIIAAFVLRQADRALHDKKRRLGKL